MDGKTPLGRCVLPIAGTKLENYGDYILGLQSKLTITFKEVEWSAGTTC